MDPERIRAYLQVACAGLGFDVGEVWWTSIESGSSAVAAIGEWMPPPPFPWSTSFDQRGSFGFSV